MDLRRGSIGIRMGSTQNYEEVGVFFRAMKVGPGLEVIERSFPAPKA
jgi:hypothetical protein